jgi:hypothetical protein
VSDRSVAKPGRRRAIREERNAGYPVRRTAATLGIGQTERTRGLHLFDLPCSGRSRGCKGGHAADPCGSRPQQVAASRRETVQFPIPRAPGLRQFTGMEQGNLLFGGGGRDVDFLGELVRHRVGKGIEILDDQQKGIGSADHILSIV